MNPRSATTTSGAAQKKSIAVAAARIADTIDAALESALLHACADGDTDRVRNALVRLERQVTTTAPHSIEELVGCAFARAAQSDQVSVVAQLLALSDAHTSLAFAATALRYNVCRTERLFPPVHPTMHCCLAMRYVGYAGVMCVEQNALRVLRFLLDSALLDDSEVVRCFVRAKQHAARFDANDPTAYRPMLRLLVATSPLLIRTTAVTNTASTKDNDDDMRALECSLAYELAPSACSVTK